MPVDRYQNSTGYIHPQESNLLDLHKSMEYDGTGKPAIRTLINTSTIQITGPVNILSTVTQGTIPWVITGTVNANLSGQLVETVLSGASNVSAFGEPYGLTITPVLQLDSIYGITSEVITTLNTGTGSTATSDFSTFVVRSGTTLGGYGVLGSKRFLRYRPGQGALCRFTAAFTTSTAMTTQRAGLFNRENAIQVGWNDDGGGPRFGVVRQAGGRSHITVLTITTAPTGNQTATITLDSVVYTIPLTAGTAQETAVQINKIDGFKGWLIDQVDNTVVFSRDTAGPNTGVFSFSSTGIGTLAAGTFNIKQAGVVHTNNWTYQGSFNIDNLDGTGPSNMVLRSQYLNVYQINFRWLGVGEIRYAIEDDSNGDMIFFHHEHYTNRNVVPHVAQPSFKIGYISANFGTNTNATVIGSSIMGAIEGEIKQNELNRSSSVNKTTLSQNQTHHLLTIRNPYVTNGKSGALNGNYVINTKEIILKDVSVATQGNDPAILYMFFEASSFTGTHNYFSQPKDNGMISTTEGTIDTTIDTAIGRFVTAINGQASYPLRDFRVTIPPGSSVSFAINSTAQISRCTLAVVFSED